MRLTHERDYNQSDTLWSSITFNRRARPDFDSGAAFRPRIAAFTP